MHSIPIPLLASNSRLRPRTALIASSDRSFRQRLSASLGSLRWQVREAEGGAQAWTEAEAAAPEAVIVDTWLPDLEMGEFLNDFRGRFPGVDIVTASGSTGLESPRGPYRQELLYALRSVQEHDASGTDAGTRSDALTQPPVKFPPASEYAMPLSREVVGPGNALKDTPAAAVPLRSTSDGNAQKPCSAERLPELVGSAPCMLEISRRVRLVAPRMTPVLIEGPTGSGKELVAEAVHRLSPRSQRPLITINCAAIPEALLEAELFGHTRGAFTGAVQGRVGRIEAADGGTLFLDEIGEMPLSLQSKLLRFVECGELQRVGDNDLVKVDVRVLAATHQPLAELAQGGKFRADLYYRLAVFLIRTPSLAQHSEDLPRLVEHFLDKAGRQSPVKRLDEGALAKLAAHDWPGNVRELEHVLERGVILAGDSSVLTEREIDFGLAMN